MNRADDVRNDTLTILLANAINRDLDVKQRAIKISKACKNIRDKTKDNELFNACRNVIKAVQDGRYTDACRAIETCERVYWLEYR